MEGLSLLGRVNGEWIGGLRGEKKEGREGEMWLICKINKKKKEKLCPCLQTTDSSGLRTEFGKIWI